MQCKACSNEMKQLTSYTKTINSKSSVVTLWRCIKCLAIEKLVAAVLLLAIFSTLAVPIRAETSANECLELFVKKGFGQAETIYYIPESIARKGINSILTIQERQVSDAKERTMMTL